MSNKRIFFAAGTCLAAILICAPAQSVHAQPAGVVAADPAVVNGSEGVPAADSAKSKKMIPPSEVRPVQLGFGKLELSWTAVERATEYRIYRSTTETGGYKKLADISETTYTDTVEPGAVYYYKIAPMRLSAKGKRLRGKVSEPQMIEAASVIPQLVSLKADVSGVNMQWSSIDGAESYVVYRSTKKTKGYKKVTTTALTNWTDMGVEQGIKYYYKVAAGHLVDGAMKYEKRSAVKAVWMVPPVPADLTGTLTENGISLQWSKATSATFYQVYRAEDGNYTLLTERIKGTAYTDTAITADKNYSYYVVAGHGSLSSAGSTPVAVKVGSIKLNTRTLFLGPGVSATLSEESGLPGAVELVSENPEIAVVDENGTVTGVAPGQTQVQVNVGAVSTSVAVNVTDCPINGIDVSKWQQAIDWKTVKASGIRFAMLRLCHGASKDIQFENYYTGATEQGIPVGTYCYTTAKSVAEGKKEAKKLLEMLDGKALTYPVALDLEDEIQLKNMNKDQRTKLILEYKKIIEDAGYQFVVYANLNWLNNYVDQKKLGENSVDIWIARYRNQSLGHGYTGGGNVRMWQYSSTGKIDGIIDARGQYINVDLDVCYGNYGSNEE